MGESNGGGGGGGSSQDAKASRTRQSTKEASREKKRQQEEMALLSQEDETGESYYVRSETGNIVRSASGNAVTTTAGRQAQEDFRAASEGREARNMAEEFPIGDSGPTTKTVAGGNEVPKTTSGPATRAARRLLAQSQKGTSMRQFYN